MIPLNDLRRDLTAVVDASQRLERDLLNQWALPLEPGRLVMDLERLEDDLAAIRASVESALAQLRAVVVLAGADDSEFWADVRELAA